MTGATGFLGNRLTDRLVASHEVWALSRRAVAKAHPRLRWILQDLADNEWRAKLPAEVDAVIHLAQSARYRDFPAAAHDIYAVSTGATMRLLLAARRMHARTFILASTGGLYGASDVPVRETDALPEPRGELGFYFATRRAAELLAMQYSGEFSTIVLRCFFIYGSGQSSRMLMPRLIASIRDGEPVRLQGEDGIRINPIHVDDAVATVERCLDLGGSRIFNLAGPEVASLRGIAAAIGARIGRDPVFAVDAIARPSDLVADIACLSRELGAPRVGIGAGIAELCADAER